MANIIFDLPEVLTSAVLSRWIQFKDFGKFHTAVCNRAGRSALTALLASENCVFDYSYKADGLERDEDEVDLPTKWILDNGVKVREIVLWGEYLEDPLRRKTLHAECTEAQTYGQIMAQCPYLHTVYIESRDRLRLPDFYPMEKLLCSTNYSVRELYLSHFNQLTDGELAGLKGLPLHTLCLKGCALVTDMAVELLAATLPQLQVFALDRCPRVNPVVLLHLPRLCAVLRSVVYIQFKVCTCCGASDPASRDLFIKEALPALFPRVKFTIDC